MENEEKARIIYEHLLTDMTFFALQNGDPKARRMEPLRIYSEIIMCLTENDFNTIVNNNIYLNVLFSPASCSSIKTNIPNNSKIITFDYNRFIEVPKEERIAILLHEVGHAFNPILMGLESEFTADDFAISHGYKIALLESLQRNVREKPREFDNDVSTQRIARMNEMNGNS